MTGPRSHPAQENRPVAAATGVASGGLGTGANLDDTQVFLTKDLAVSEASGAAPDAEGPPEPSAEPVHHESVAHEPVAQPVEAPASSVPIGAAVASPPAPPAQPEPPAPTPVHAAPVHPTVARRESGSHRQRRRGLAGVLAATLVVLAGVAFLVTREAATPAAGQTVPSAGAPATAQPDGNGAAGGGGGAGNGDPGKDDGKDRGKPCRGNGNSRGCGD